MDEATVASKPRDDLVVRLEPPQDHPPALRSPSVAALRSL